MKNITIALGYGSNGWQAASSFQLGLPQESKDGRHSYGRGRELALQLSTAVVIKAPFRVAARQNAMTPSADELGVILKPAFHAIVAARGISFPKEN